MELNREALIERSNEVLQAVTSPEFLAQLEAVRAVPVEHRLAEAARRLTPDAMRRAGVRLPEGIRISSRYFEEGQNFNIELGDIPRRISVVPAIMEIDPDFLDKLRVARPDVFTHIVTEPPFAGDDLTNRWSVCGCAGGGFCGGIGGGP